MQASTRWHVSVLYLHVSSLQRQDGLMQRSIREVNTSSRWCVLWDLDEDTHYSVQVTHTHTHAHTLTYQPQPSPSMSHALLLSLHHDCVA